MEYAEARQGKTCLPRDRRNSWGGPAIRGAGFGSALVFRRPIAAADTRVGGSATFPLVYGQVTFIGEWSHDDDREHPACPHRTENQLPALYLAALHRAHRAGAIRDLVVQLREEFEQSDCHVG